MKIEMEKVTFVEPKTEDYFSRGEELSSGFIEFVLLHYTAQDHQNHILSVLSPAF